VQPLLRWKSRKYYTTYVCVCVCFRNLRYPAYNGHAPYWHLWPASLYNILPYFLINGMIFEKKKKIIELSPIRATCPIHLILLDFITRTITGEEHKSLSSLLYSFLHSPVTSSLLGQHIPLITLFSNILSLRSFLNVSDQVSHPYTTAGKIIVLYILIFDILDSKLEDKRFCTE